jgi:hypothetical protein
MLFRLGIICSLLTNALIYSNQDFDLNIVTIDMFDEDDDDYSDLEADLKLLEEEDTLYN